MKSKSQTNANVNPHPVSEINVEDIHSSAEESHDSNPSYLGSSTVASLLDVSPATLRNYVWLQSIPLKERQRRGLQSPPSKMPRPKRIRGRLYWNAQFFNKWLSDRIH